MMRMIPYYPLRMKRMMTNNSFPMRLMMRMIPYHPSMKMTRMRMRRMIRLV